MSNIEIKPPNSTEWQHGNRNKHIFWVKTGDIPRCPECGKIVKPKPIQLKNLLNHNNTIASLS